MNYIKFFCIICYLSALYSKVNGGDITLSLEEELEIEKELSRLNKPALETIKISNGDVYDCIDFYKQPAFDHPLLKSHEYHHQMRPASYPINMNKTKKVCSDQSIKIGLPGKSCPIGTVPIRRTTKEDLIRARLIGRSYGSKQSNDGTQYRAVVRSQGEKYNGGSGTVSIYRPSIRGSQYSGAQMTVGNGFDSIEVGWMVIGDGQTRFFIRTTNNASSCLNACSGFIIVDTQFPLGFIFTYISKSGGPIYGFNFFIYRESTSGRWWLAVGPDWEEIGFWPPEIFDGLKDLASYVEWGGQTGTDPAFSGPAMGTGDYPEIGDPRQDAYWRRISTVNLDHKIVDAPKTQAYWDLHKYYAFESTRFSGAYKDSAFFGGPGPKN